MSIATVTEQEVARIEAALHQTMTAIHQTDQAARQREPISARDSLAQYLEKRTSFTPLQLEVDDLLERPWAKPSARRSASTASASSRSAA